MERDEVLNCRVPGDLKEALREAAEKDDRSVSAMTVSPPTSIGTTSTGITGDPRDPG